MEKRIITAFVLSFIVLLTWSTLNPAPRKTVSNPSQIVVNKENVVVLDPASASVISKSSEIILTESIRVLENDKIKVEFSNIGGSIKSIVIKEFNTSLPITNIFSVADATKKEFTVEQNTKNKITYSFQNGKEKIIKTYSLSNQDYLIDVNVQTEGLSNLEFGAYQVNSSSLDKKIFQSPEKSLFEYSIGLFNQVIRKDNAIDFTAKENKNQSGEVSWIGYRDRYFCFVLKPKFKIEKFSVVAQDPKNLFINVFSSGKSLNNYDATIYIGPQKINILAAYNQGFENIMVFSNWGILDIFAKMIYFFVHFLYNILKSWGFAILVLGFSLYVVTYPLTAKSMASMRKMQALQPKMKSLQEKYKNDPQRLNQEMMELYRENKVNPFGGCLPMLLQMPIFYGLYQVLWRSVDFKGANFFWIKDLSLPDRLATLPWALPFFGNEVNILPLLMAIIMFFQQKFTSKNMVITDENQLMQQKMMAVLMPVMMGFIFYHFASGLCLYFTTFYLLSTLTAWKMSKLADNVK